MLDLEADPLAPTVPADEVVEGRVPGAGPDDAPPTQPVRRRSRFDPMWVWFGRLPPEAFVTLFVVASCVAFVWFQVAQGTILHPGGNILADNTPAGGDMGAHVWGPAYLRDTLLPQGRLAGWTPDWYAGFPAYQFYMVLPSLAIALLSFVMPYGIAFKIVTVSGVVSLPVCAWAFGKLTDTPFPGPPMFAVGATMFLFDRGFSIYGGNIPSTLAGEFAFSISLSFALLYLGLLARALRTGQGRGWAAVVLALVGLNHLIPLIFAVVCTVLMLVVFPAWRAKRYAFIGVPAIVGVGVLSWLSRGPQGDFTTEKFDDTNKQLVAALGILMLLGLVTSGWQRMKVWFPILAIGGLLTAWWTVPFYLQHKYMNDMGWEKKTDYVNMLYTRTKLDPQLVDSPKIAWIMLAAAAGGLLAMIWGRRSGIFLVAVAFTFAAMFVVTPQLRLWNARLLPFYYLSMYLLAGLGIAEVGRLLSLLFARDVMRPVRWISGSFAVVGLGVGLGIVAFPLRLMPFATIDTATNTYSWPPSNWPVVGGMFTTKDSSFIPSWAKWNYTGYEAKEAYPEYYGITQKMAEIGRERGCGRAMWEHEEQHDRFGTPMALMLLPFWTDGCIGSMEGLYFEASSTTPYHFLNQDALSTGPSNAQRDLPYGPGAPTKDEFDLGIRHLQMLGVKYYMAVSDGMQTLATDNPDLSEAGSYGPWKVYEVNKGNALVEGLKFQPAVLEGVAFGGDSWLKPSVAWYMNPEAWDVPLANDGPATWQRVREGVGPGLKTLDPVVVTNIVEGRDSISFDVDRVGVPVVVKSSYFPNWKSSGADGPWRLTPNLMVVVPSANSVSLTYGYTAIDYLSWVLTLMGVSGAVVLFRRRAVVLPASWGEQMATQRREAAAAAMAAVDAGGVGGGLLPAEDALWIASLASDDPDDPDDPGEPAEPGGDGRPARGLQGPPGPLPDLGFANVADVSDAFASPAEPDDAEADGPP